MDKPSKNKHKKAVIFDSGRNNPLWSYYSKNSYSGKAETHQSKVKTSKVSRGLTDRRFTLTQSKLHFVNKIVRDHVRRFTDEQISEFNAIYKRLLSISNSTQGEITEDFFDQNIDRMLILLGLDEDSIEIVEKIKNQKQDLNNDNIIDFDEFFEFCSKSIAIFNEIDLLEDAFRIFDTDGDGFVSLAELKTSLNVLVDQSNEDIDEIYHLTGLSRRDNQSKGLKDGLLDFQSFLKIIVHRSLENEHEFGVDRFSELVKNKSLL